MMTMTLSSTMSGSRASAAEVNLATSNNDDDDDDDEVDDDEDDNDGGVVQHYVG